MRSVFILFLSLAIFAPGVNAGPPACQPTVDAFATANAPWKVGEQMRQYTIMLDTDPMHRDRFPSSYSNIVRRFQGMTPEGCFLVQDFYQQADASGRPIPYTSPVALTNAADAARVVFALSNAHVANGVEGSLNLWMPDGTPLLEGHYHDEQKTGHWRVWYSNGQKQTEGDFANDMALGTWMSWHPNGQKRLETNFENGQLHGRVTEWDDAGRKTRETVFDHGALVEETDFQPLCLQAPCTHLAAYSPTAFFTVFTTKVPNAHIICFTPGFSHAHWLRKWTAAHRLDQRHGSHGPRSVES